MCPKFSGTSSVTCRSFVKGPQRKAPRSLGSGFIISSDGYILTNHHVIKDAEEVLVRLNDRRELQAEVIGSDERTDVALLRVDARDLPVVKKGSSADLKVGEWVLAIGSPFGFDHSVTAGIVSATERALANETYVPFIQTDVAINPGNSGGPLFNLDGEVVGINSQIYTRSGGFMGLSFAIPIDVAMDVADQLKNQGFVQRGWLGVIIQEVNRRSGRVVRAQEAGGSAGRQGAAGQSCTIRRAAGRGCNPQTQWQASRVVLRPAATGWPYQARSDCPPGGVMRSGEREMVELVIGTMPDEPQQASRSAEKPAETGRLGLVVAPLDPSLKDKWAISSGVMVQQVQEGAGLQAGLVRGDVITMLNGKRIETVEQFEQVASALPAGRSVPLRIVRRGSPLFIALKTE